MNTKTNEIPQQTLNLPETQNGYSREVVTHTTFKDGHSAGVYTIRDPEGRPMPFGFQFNTRKNGLTGFTVPGIESVMSWTQLRRYYALAGYEIAERARSVAAELRAINPDADIAHLLCQLADENDRLRAVIWQTKPDAASATQPTVQHLPADDTEGGAA